MAVHSQGSCGSLIKSCTSKSPICHSFTFVIDHLPSQFHNPDHLPSQSTTLNICHPSFTTLFVNPRRTCATRVMVVGSVCLSVCRLSHISPLEHLFVLKLTTHTQRATKVKRIVGISLKLLRCGNTPLPALYGYLCSPPFYSVKMCMRIVFLHGGSSRSNTKGKYVFLVCQKHCLLTQ